MSATEIALTAYVTFLSAGVTLLVWRQVTGLRTEMRQEIRELRTEMRQELGALRAELAIMRSDLTQVALAVGAKPRRASEA